MSNAVIEVVTFKLNPGVSDADYVAASQMTEDFVRGLPGFVARSLSKGEDGSWMDYVIWSDMTAAREAAATFPQADCTADMMRMIDPATVALRHETRLWMMAAA